jgi:hypothetical protein
MAESWRTAKVVDMTGEQLFVAVRQGILAAVAVLALISLLVGFVVGLIVELNGSGSL